MYNGADSIFNPRKPQAFSEMNKSLSIKLFFWSSLDTNIESKLLGVQSHLLSNLPNYLPYYADIAIIDYSTSALSERP